MPFLRNYFLFFFRFFLKNPVSGSGPVVSAASKVLKISNQPLLSCSILSWHKKILRRESIFKKIYPETAFQSRFFDESLERLYKREQQTSQIMNIAMGIAIFISYMGLFGLAAFTANQRTREIGIRKVLGAGVPN